MTTSPDLWSEFDALTKELIKGVDVLIQLTEIFEVMTFEKDRHVKKPGRKTFLLTQHAIGFEIVSRIYRLIDTQLDGQCFYTLRNKYLTDKNLLELLQKKFNCDETRSSNEFDELVEDLRNFIDQFYNSLEWRRIRVFRQRYTGHLIPNPNVLAKLGPDADVNSLEPLDLISLTKVLAEATDKMAYLKGRDHFPHQDIAKIASEDAYELWGDTEE